jgi:hypothetical protein
MSAQITLTAEDHMAELLVFISSIMDKQREDLFLERDAAKEAINSLNLTRSWRFEDSPASSQRVDYSYLNKVAESDIFVLLLGRDITTPVRMEYDAAIDGGKPLLVFLKKVDRKPETEAFVKELKIKWKTFDGVDALKGEIRAALAEELINAHRQNRVKLPENDVEKLKLNLRPGTVIHADNVAGGNLTVTQNRSAGRDYFEARDHAVINVSSGTGASDLATLLDGMKAVLAELKLPPIDEKRVRHALDGARIEAEAPAVDKTAVASRLQEAADIVKSAGNVALEATTFVKLMKKALAWAGLAASGLIG